VAACQWSHFARNKVWVVQQRSASQSLSDGVVNGAVKYALIMSGMSCLVARRINLLVPSPTLSARTWWVANTGRQCDRPHNVGGHTASSRRSVTDPSHYTCPQRLILRCSPCGTVKGSVFVTTSSYLSTMNGYHVQKRNRKKNEFSVFR